MTLIDRMPTAAVTTTVVTTRRARATREVRVVGDVRLMRCTNPAHPAEAGERWRAESEFRVLGHGYRASWCRRCENAPQRRRPRPTPHQQQVLRTAAARPDGMVQIGNPRTAAALVDERYVEHVELGGARVGCVYRITDQARALMGDEPPRTGGGA